MMTKNSDKKREQMIMLCMDDMVPQNHMLRLIDKAIDWTFIYELVEEKYCPDNGRPSMDPVPHFSTFGKNYTRRFKDTDQIFVESTHVKACANSKKMRKRVAHEQALWYEEKLQKEISRDREAHGKKPFKEKGRKDPPSGGGSDNNTKEEEITEGIKTQKCSTSDPESGWFRKGEHKHVFAYAVETACDKHGWILGYSIHPGNEHDSRTFKILYDKIKIYSPAMIIADAGYRTPAIAHELLEDGIEPLFPYKRPMTKEGFFRKYEYAYDEYYDCYICPENHILSYQTTNREGYKYVSCGEICASCPNLHRCTESKEHIKVVTRHVWEEYMEKAKDIRHTLGNKQIYDLRKETIDRIFGTAKEQHGFRYTQYIGRARMEMKAGLTFACMNLKKLARILDKREERISTIHNIERLLKEKTFLKKSGAGDYLQHQLCLQSEGRTIEVLPLKGLFYAIFR